MPKSLLLKHYRGGAEPHRPFPPMGQSSPDDVEAALEDEPYQRRHSHDYPEAPMNTAKPDIVTPEQWRAAREALLVQEKAHTRARDALAAERRRMPMIRVEKDYRFTAPGGGDVTLLDLFDGSRQLVLYRFFMDPDMDVYPERGCPGCSMYADQLSNLLHLRERDTRFVAVSRGEQEHLQRYREQMGWEFPWYTLRDDFDADHDVAEWHGTNVFLRDGDEVYRTLHRRPWRRGARVDLELPRHHAIRPPGGVGGLPRGLAADPALHLGRLARQVRPHTLTCSPTSQASPSRRR
jgi:predicted dithiol-disulfide oxidoreductase (DUF899 family)